MRSRRRGFDVEESISDVVDGRAGSQVMSTLTGDRWSAPWAWTGWRPSSVRWSRLAAQAC
jgi:hypothetical protein